MVGDRAVWVTMRHALWKVPPEHVRPATSQESLGIEVLNKYMSSMQQELASRDSRRGPRRYIDGMREPGPSEEGADDPFPMATDVSAQEQDRATPMQEEEATERATPMMGEEATEHEHLEQEPTHQQNNDDEPSETASRQEEDHESRPEGEGNAEAEEEAFRAEAAIIRRVIEQAPPLQVPASWQGEPNMDQTAIQRENVQDESLNNLLRHSLSSRRHPPEEHPDSPARQRPRRQTFPYPTPQDWHQTSAGQYMSHVFSVMAPTERMVSVERTGKGAKGAVITDPLVPRLRDCRRRVTIDWSSNQVLEDLDMRGGQHRSSQRRWPAHVSHTETFFIFPSMFEDVTFNGAQVTIKDTLVKEINIWRLPEEQQKMFLTDVKRGRLKEWLSVKESGAVQVHEGEVARKIRAELKERCVPSRWLDKWKVAGPVAHHGLMLSQGNWVDPRIEAKSRWIVQGFHDPDIDLVSRSVPTPATGDVPMALQLMACFGIQAWTADCKSAFMQSDQGQRPQPLFALPPSDTDAKSLFDTVGKESYSHTERRAALEVSVIRDSLKLLEGQIRWVPHALNAADSMTKIGANSQSMVRLLEEGWLQLRSEENVLAERKKFREETGRQCPRPHRKM
eukprot:3546775-Amphidinium_carterae.2